LLTTLRLFGLLAGFFLVCLLGRAQTAARQPSYPLLSSGKANIEAYVFNESNKFSKIDNHSFQISNKDISSLEELSRELCPSDFSELEKVRSIYFWIAKNIQYDDDGLKNNTLTSQKAEEVFKTRKAVCEGFSNFFYELCHDANIEARVIPGYAKDEFYNKEKILVYPNHAWSAVNIDDQWHLLDVTWACLNRDHIINKNNDVEYFKHKLESNFLIDPKTFIQNHLPEDPYWQLLPDPIDLQDFFSGNIVVDTDDVNIDVNQRIDQFESLDSLDQEIAYCQRMVPNEWNRIKEYRLGTAYYFKAQQLYRKLGQVHGRPKERLAESIYTYYDKSLEELRRLAPDDFGYEYCQELISTIESRKDLIIIKN